MFGRSKTRDVTPHELNDMLKGRQIALIDVREPGEFALERIPGSVNHPLSTFDPSALPQGEGLRMIMQCGSGKRSLMAAALCQKAGLAVDSHLAGGIAAWRQAGLPIVDGRSEPA